MGHEREILNLLLEDHVYPLDWASEFSPEICVVAAKDLIAPVAPSSVAATAKLERILVSWTNPTENADGTTCTDLLGVNVYYASKATHDAEGSIDIDNGDTYDGVIRISAEEWKHDVAAEAQYYYVVTSVDRTENEGIASSEVNATALTVGDSTDVPTDATGLIFDDVAIGDGILVVVTNVPTATWVGFSYYRLWYSVKNGSWGAWVEIGPIGRYGYTHKNLDTTKVYKYKATIVGEGTDNESSTADTLDNSGAGYQPNAADNSSIGAILIAAQTIVGLREVRAPNITCDNLAAINADLGAITAGSMDAARITTGTLVVARTQAKCPVADADKTSTHTALNASNYTGSTISTGYTAAKCTDALADQTSAHNCANPGDYTATIINGGLVTTGTLSLNDGSVTKAGITAVGAGDTNVRIWAGSTYAARATAPFRVTQGGKCYATDFYTLSDTSDDVITSGVFQGARLIDSGITGANVGGDGTPPATYFTKVWDNVTKTVPANKQWVVIVAQNPEGTDVGEFGFYNPNTANDLGTVIGFELYLLGVFHTDAVDYGARLSSGTYNGLDLTVDYFMRLFDPNANYDQWSTSSVFWMVLEVPV